MKTLNKLLIVILVITVVYTGYIRFRMIGCWKATLFLEKEELCQERQAEKMGFGKTTHEKWAADAKTGLIKENYSVQTLPATNIKSNSATLNGIITDNINDIPPNGLPYFYYGTSKDEMNFSTDPYSFKILGNYSVVLLGLEPHTTYYYRAAIGFNTNTDSIKESEVILKFTTQ